MIKYGIASDFSLGDSVIDNSFIKQGSVSTVPIGKVVTVSHEDNKVVAQFENQFYEYALDGAPKSGKGILLKKKIESDEPVTVSADSVCKN